MSQLPNSNKIPNVLSNAKIYNEGNELYGTADVEVPSYEYMSENLSGFGISGELELPVQGHFKAMKSKVKWNAANETSIKLMDSKAHQLEVYGSIQEYDAGTGSYIQTAVKMVMKCAPLSGSIGKLEAAKKMEGENEFSVSYVKLWIGGKEMLEIDPLNFICMIDGVDQLKEIRKNLGM